MRRQMLNVLAVALGAAVGANLRYGIALWMAARVPAGFPYATLLINLLGCLAIGLLLGLVAAGALHLSEPLRLLLVTGLLGGFTTFSTFGYEAFTMISAGDWRGAAIYMAVSTLVGLGAVFLGVWGARAAVG